MNLVGAWYLKEGRNLWKQWVLFQGFGGKRNRLLDGIGPFKKGKKRKNTRKLFWDFSSQDEQNLGFPPTQNFQRTVSNLFFEWGKKDLQVWVMSKYHNYKTRCLKISCNKNINTARKDHQWKEIKLQFESPGDDAVSGECSRSRLELANSDLLSAPPWIVSRVAPSPCNNRATVPQGCLGCIPFWYQIIVWEMKRMVG